MTPEKLKAKITGVLDKVTDAIDNSFLYAVFDEYGSVFPVTIRRTADGAKAAYAKDLEIDVSAVLDGGNVLGKWSCFIDGGVSVGSAIEWVEGWRAEE